MRRPLSPLLIDRFTPEALRRRPTGPVRYHGSMSPSRFDRTPLALLGLLAALGLWPVGLVGAFFLFFGDGPRHGPDPRDRFIPVYLAMLFTLGVGSVGLALSAIRQRPWLSVAALVVGAPWWLLAAAGMAARLRR